MNTKRFNVPDLTNFERLLEGYIQQNPTFAKTVGFRRLKDIMTRVKTEPLQSRMYLPYLEKEFRRLGLDPSSRSMVANIPKPIIQPQQPVQPLSPQQPVQRPVPPVQVSGTPTTMQSLAPGSGFVPVQFQSWAEFFNTTPLRF